MNMSAFKHNKKRNTGLVYEFLIRHLSRSMIEKDELISKKVVEIVRRYFDPGTILAEEKELFDAVRNARGLTESAARRVLGEVVRAAEAMDRRKVDIKKSNVIKEINHSFGKGFFDAYRLPEYKLLASIQLLIDSAGKSGLISESVKRIQLEEGIVKYMTTTGEYGMQVIRREEIDQLVMRMVTKRFKDKYGGSFASSQKSLLEKYIRMQVTGDERPLKEFIEGEHKRIGESLARALTMREVREDEIMKEKLDEALSSWKKTGSVAQSLDHSVEETMVFQKLVEEIESDG